MRDVITALQHTGGCSWGCCLAFLTASMGAGIERLNLQQGRFHLDIKKKLFSSKDVKHQDKPGRL